jgi:hypothetical protein|tara:strand:- start:149 stop:496 length:348 start_codon:yes stop_codon:yes gene_type:complete
MITYEDIAAFAEMAEEGVQAGYVYAMTNNAWDGWVKIGKAINAEDRLRSYQTSSPMRDYKLIHYVPFDDVNAAERKAHLVAARMTAHPWNKPDNGEWFKLTEEQAMEVLREVTLD